MKLKIGFAIAAAFNYQIDAATLDRQAVLSDQACQPGFFSVVTDFGYECHLKICKCARGDPYTGVDCPKHGERGCKNCVPGHHHVSYENGQDSCDLNVCQCSNGPAYTDVECPEHGKQGCKSCTKPGFHFVSLETGDECHSNVCACTHGPAYTGADCVEHGKQGCENCNTGHHWIQQETGDICPINQCACDNGQGYTGAECAIHDHPNCEKCDEGYVLVKGVLGRRCESIDKIEKHMHLNKKVTISTFLGGDKVFLDVPGQQFESGTTAWFWPENRSKAQQWVIRRLGENKFKIQPWENNSLVLDVSGSYVEEATDILLFDEKNDDDIDGNQNQIWSVVEINDDGFVFQPNHAFGMVLSCQDNNSQELFHGHPLGKNAVLMEKNDIDEQSMRIELF